MPELFTFLIKVNIALVLFCLGYYLVLRKLTFYTLNRAYLVTAIIFSSVYPLIDLSVLAQRHQEIVAPVQNVVIIWKAPAEHLIKQAAYWNWLEVLFWAGAALFAVRLLFQLASLYKIYCRSTKQEINGQTVRVVSGDIGPFSFWRSIYINPKNLSATDLKNVIAHEQVHINEWHTLDILLTEISVIFYWFNPGIWLMKRAVRENIEFITDRKILQRGTDSKAYQYSLLNITFNQPAPAVTSSFNFSTLKKRIMMMNANRSSKINLTRYAFLVPVVVVCLFTFSLSKAEVVKKSSTFKAVATAVENIKRITLKADTTPVKRTVTETTTTKKTKGGVTTIKTVTVTTTDDKLQNQSSAKDLIKNVENTTVSMRGFKGDDSVLIIVNDKVVKAGINSIDPNSIQTVSVLKTGARDFLQSRMGTEAPAVENYHGVIYITTKPNNGGSLTIRPGFNNVEVVGYGLPNIISKRTDTVGALNNRITLRGTNSSGPNPPLILIDGKESSIESMDPEKIESMTVLKGSTAIPMYGEKAKHGVVIITTKKK